MNELYVGFSKSVELPNTRAKLPPLLRRNVLLIKGKVASGTTVEDAETLAAYARLGRGTNGFNEFVQDAIG